MPGGLVGVAAWMMVLCDIGLVFYDRGCGSLVDQRLIGSGCFWFSSLVGSVAPARSRNHRNDKGCGPLIIYIVCIPLGLEEHVIAWQVPHMRRSSRRRRLVVIALFTTLVMMIVAIDHCGRLLLTLISFIVGIIRIICSIVWGLAQEFLGQAGTGVPMSRSSRF